jgi:uncharacterized protein with GYD domain
MFIRDLADRKKRKIGARIFLEEDGSGRAVFRKMATRSVVNRYPSASGFFQINYIGEESDMPYYLLQMSDSREGWEALMKVDLKTRLQFLSMVVEKIGGKIEGCWAALGDCDWIMICQMPDSICAAAFSVALSAGGAVKAVKTTPLLTVDETGAALQKATASGYRAPQP